MVNFKNFIYFFRKNIKISLMVNFKNFIYFFRKNIKISSTI